VRRFDSSRGYDWAVEIPADPFAQVVDRLIKGAAGQVEVEDRLVHRVDQKHDPANRSGPVRPTDRTGRRRGLERAGIDDRPRRSGRGHPEDNAPCQRGAES
jgi:hypothetical protein